MKTISVSELNYYIKHIYENDYLLSKVYVSGELSNFRISRGHYYFTIKDEVGASIDCILFSNVALKFTNMFEIGQKVIVEGKVSFYEKLGRTSLIANNIEVDGLGKYYIELEKLKRKLESEGLFEKSRKKELPKYVSKIGVITSINGAVIEDIKRTVWEKNPYIEINLYPAKVQGEGAEVTIINGINAINNTDCDVIVIARGGGSKEDLSCFNNEALARCISESNIPIVAAIGHEIDYSIADMVADKTVATPTAAAELVTYSYFDTIDSLDAINDGMINIIKLSIDDFNEKLSMYEMNLLSLSPKSKLDSQIKELNSKIDLININVKNKLNSIKNKYELYFNTLKSLDAMDKLELGYAYVTDKNNKKIISTKPVKKDDILNIRMKDGKLKAKVI